MFWSSGKRAGGRRPPAAAAKPAVKRAPQVRPAPRGGPRWSRDDRGADERAPREFVDPPVERPAVLRRLPKGVFAPLAAIIVVLALGLLGRISITMRHHQLGLDVTLLTSERDRLTDLNRQLRADMDKLTIIEDLESVAIETLGLVRPAEGQIEIIE